MNLDQCNRMTPEELRKTAYYRNLPRYLLKMGKSHTEICHEISSRYHLSKLSGNRQIRDMIIKLREHGFYTKKRFDRARVHYAHYLDYRNMEDYLTRIPQIATNGDKHIILPNGEQIARTDIPKHGLLSLRERRLARKKVISTPNLVFAMGGYPRSGIHYVDKPFEAIVLSMAGHQFEFDGLEYRDFVIDERWRKTEQRHVLFPQYYPHSLRQLATFDEAAKQPNLYYQIDRRHYLDRMALFYSMVEDVTLLLTAFASHVEEGKRGWLHATAMGTGFFANFLRNKDLSPLIFQTLLGAYELVLRTTPVGHPIRKIGVIIFPDFSQNRAYTPKFKLDWVSVKGER